MTLADWCKMAYTEPLPADGGAVSVRCDPSLYPTLYAQLWRLSDYRVDTSWGVVVWLMPKPAPYLLDIDRDRVTGDPIGGADYRPEDI